MEKIAQVELLKPDIYPADQIRFNLLALAARHKTARIFTDQRHVVVCQVNTRTPIWIWTHPEITKEELAQLRECLTMQFIWKSYTTVMTKPELREFVAGVMEEMFHEPVKNQTKIMTYGWHPSEYKGKKIGHMEKADEKVLDKLAEFRARDINEMEHLGVCISDLKKEAAWMIHSGNAYLWRNSEGKLTSLAFVAHRFPNQARINRVYTYPNMRNRGYASMLMHELASHLYEEGRTAVVYADALYPPSNCTYRKSGFVEQGMLYEIGI